MSREINHENRRKIILRKSLLLFAEQGYSSVTFQKIADSCGISRTTLYRYFRDKREILDASILNFFTPMLEKQRGIASGKNITARKKLKDVFETTIDSMCEERSLLTRILEYLLIRKKTGEEISGKISRHTWKQRLLIHRLLAEGVSKGEFRPMNLRVANNLLYSQLETLAFRLIVREETDREEAVAMVESILLGLRADKI